MRTRVWVGTVGAIFGIALIAWIWPRAESDQPLREPAALESVSIPRPPRELESAILDPASVEPRKAAPSPTAPASASASHPRSGVIGRLRFPSGRPAAGSTLTLFRKTQPTFERWKGDAVLMPSGEFELSATAGEFVLVASAEGVLPLSVDVSVPNDRLVDVGELTFAEAAYLRGVVSLSGASTVEGCRVSASLVAQAEDFTNGSQRLAWVGGRAVKRSGETTARNDGWFSIEGLEPGLHCVQVDAMNGARIAKAFWNVTAPADGLRLDLDYGRLLIRVEADGAPTEAQITCFEESDQRQRSLGGAWRAGRSGGAWGGGHGQGLQDFGQWASSVEVRAPPGTSYYVIVDKEGFCDATMNVRVPPAGQSDEQTVKLVPRADLAELDVRLIASDGMRLERAGFALFDLVHVVGRDPFSFGRTGSDGRTPDFQRDLRAEAGVFKLTGIPPGKYRLEIQADSTWDEASNYRAPSLEVELAANALEQRELAVLAGGRLRVRCVDPKGAGVSAACRLFDPSGRELSGPFVAREFMSVWNGSTAALNGSAPGGTSEFAEVLEPGAYEARFSLEGFVPVSRSFTIEQGKTTEVSCVLVRA